MKKPPVAGAVHVLGTYAIAPQGVQMGSGIAAALQLIEKARVEALEKATAEVQAKAVMIEQMRQEALDSYRESLERSKPLT